MSADRPGLKVPDALARWRLLLGAASETSMGGLEGQCASADAALEWLYGRDPKLDVRGERRGGAGASQLTTPDWINAIHELFPKEVIERLEQDAVERFGIHEVVTNIDVLERIEPSETLLRAVLQTKNLMNPEVLGAARALVAEVVRRIMERLASEVRRAFNGTRDRRRRSSTAIATNFDFKRTVVANLKHWDRERGKLYLERAAFFSRVRKHAERWDVILLIDQSASMVGSVIHAAVMAACLWNLPGMRTYLVAFDTNVVDLTADVSDPVELLMNVQLGGGTDIGKAVAYSQSLVNNPRRSIVVLVSDFYEGGRADELVERVRSLTASGVTVLGLAALDAQADPCYDREMGERLVRAGAYIAAMTPGELAAWLAEKMGR